MPSCCLVLPRSSVASQSYEEEVAYRPPRLAPPRLACVCNGIRDEGLGIRDEGSGMSTKVVLPLGGVRGIRSGRIPGCYVTKTAPHKALTLIA